MLTVNGAHHPRCVSRDDVTPTFFDHRVSVRCSHARPRGLSSSPITLVGAVAGLDGPRSGGRRVIGQHRQKPMWSLRIRGRSPLHYHSVLYQPPIESPSHYNQRTSIGNLKRGTLTQQGQRETIDPPRNTISQEIKQHRKKEKTT
jgi:hypothetical protein